MKKLLLILLMLGFTSIANAQCVAEVKDVYLEDSMSRVIVKTQYTLNGIVVDVRANPCDNCTTEKPYTEDSASTYQEFINVIKNDTDKHCENILMRKEENKAFIYNAKSLIQKDLSKPIIDNIKSLLIGQKRTINSVTKIYKNKEITVTYDSNNTISNVVE